MAYMPYFSTPDPSVKRKSGFLMPIITTSSACGLGVEMPYYLALAPNYDLTISPRITTTQGPCCAPLSSAIREGSLTVRASGIDQLDKNAFIRSDGSTPRLPRVARHRNLGKFGLSPSGRGAGTGLLRSDLLPGLQDQAAAAGGTDPS
jgi:LPS-assembly protein